MTIGGILVMVVAAGVMLGGWLAVELTSRRLTMYRAAASRPTAQGDGRDVKSSDDVAAAGQPYSLLHVDFVRAGRQPPPPAEKGLTSNG